MKNTKDIYNTFLTKETIKVSDIKKLINDIHFNEFEVDFDVVKDIPNRFNISKDKIANMLLPTFQRCAEQTLSNVFNHVNRTNGATTNLRDEMARLGNIKANMLISDNTFTVTIKTMANHIVTELIKENETTKYPSINIIKNFAHSMNEWLSNDIKNNLINIKVTTSFYGEATLLKRSEYGVKRVANGMLSITKELITFSSDKEHITIKMNSIAKTLIKDGEVSFIKKNGKPIEFKANVPETFGK